LPVYNVKDFNVVGDGATLNTLTIQQAIDKAAGDGGGVVYFPSGNYVSGTIQIGSNVMRISKQGLLSGEVKTGKIIFMDFSFMLKMLLI